jgi:hypothetical protein
MAIRILVIFLPYLVGLMWRDQPEASIALSLVSSILIAGIAQTDWFRQSGEKMGFTHHLLRPASMFHFIFVAYNVLGGAAYALNAAGYTLGRTVIPSTGDLFLLAECQRLMLLSHTSITAGMKLAGFRYEKPKYMFPSIPPYSLIIVSFIGLGLGTLISSMPLLGQLSQKFLMISTAAISVDIALCIQRKRFNNLLLTLVLLGLNLLQQAVSGWKGGLLSTMIILGAMLYPLMPRRVILGGVAFLLFWALYFYPFGLALRPLIWHQGVEQDRAVEMSMDRALNMSLDERLDTVWEMMVGRANDLDQFVKYVEYVPANHPYYQFEILNNATIALIPRILWQEKPDLEKISMQRVYEAGIASRQSDVSAKSNFYQDAYLSWGEEGIILTCLLFGILTSLFSRACERLFGGYVIGTCIIYTSLFSAIVNQPSNFEYFLAASAMAIVLMLAIFALGRTTGWIIPASNLSQLPENHSQNGEGRKREAPPLSDAAGLFTQLLRFRR